VTVNHIKVSQLLRDDLKIVISGGTGFIGKALIQHLVKENNQIVVLTRTPGKYDNPNPGWLNQCFGTVRPLVLGAIKLREPMP
jgi:nucleoside-diphosphate-sugar epimerase